jgi:hypothetical protein
MLFAVASCKKRRSAHSKKAHTNATAKKVSPPVKTEGPGSGDGELYYVVSVDRKGEVEVPRGYHRYITRSHCEKAAAKGTASSFNLEKERKSVNPEDYYGYDQYSCVRVKDYDAGILPNPLSRLPK